jgi:hypothetical protein
VSTGERPPIRDPLVNGYDFDIEFERQLAQATLQNTDVWRRKQDAAAMLAALDHIDLLLRGREKAKSGL